MTVSGLTGICIRNDDKGEVVIVRMMHTLILHYYAPDEGSDSEAGMMVIDPKLDSLVKIVGGLIGDEATDMYNALRYGTQKVTIMEKDKI